MQARFDIEKEFHQVVRGIGGTVVADTISKSPSFCNADYIFHSQKTVAELKCLTEDKFCSKTITDRVPALWQRWRDNGWVTGSVPKVLAANKLPRQCGEELIHLIGRSIWKQLEKANKQIKATIQEFELEGYTGMVIIANTNNRALPPAALVHYLYAVLRKDFRAIESFVAFSANLPATYGNSGVPIHFWHEGYFEDTPKPSIDFLKELHLRWAEQYSSIVGVPFLVEDNIDMQAFWKSQYI